MSGAIRVEQIRDGYNISDQTELRGMIRLEQSRVKASSEKRGRPEQSENITERDRSRAKREKKCSDKIREESEKNSVEQTISNSVVQKNAEQGEDPTVEGRKTTVANYTERWKIMR